MAQIHTKLQKNLSQQVESAEIIARKQRLADLRAEKARVMKEEALKLEAFQEQETEINKEMIKFKGV